jgi:hypothetical protein
MAILETIANLAEILTSVIAFVAGVWYWCDQRQKRNRLEEYLKANTGKTAHTILHLMARVGLTEDEILKASFKSTHIARKLHENPDTHLADGLLFEYHA